MTSIGPSNPRGSSVAAVGAAAPEYHGETQNVQNGTPRRMHHPALWRELVPTRLDILRCRPLARANAALVMITPRGEFRTFTSDRQPALRELLLPGFHALYEVDCGVRQNRLVTELPSSSEAFAFQAEIDFTWQVVTPELVVRNSIQHLGQGILPRVLNSIREIARRYDIEKVSEAECAVNDRFADVPFGVEYGIAGTAVARLTMDSVTKAHVSQVFDVERRLELERRTQQLRLLQEHHRGLLVDDRIRRYRAIIGAGDINQFALQLAENPEDVPAVVKMLRDEQLTNRSETVDFVTKLVASGAIDRWEIDQQVRDALNWLRSSTNKVIGKPIEVGGAAVPERQRPAGVVLSNTALPQSEQAKPESCEISQSNLAAPEECNVSNGNAT